MIKYKIFLYILFTIPLFGQEVNLRGITELKVNIQLCKELSDYTDEYTLKKLIELELMNGGLRITDNDESNNILSYTIICTSRGIEISASLHTLLMEKVYVPRIKKSERADIYFRYGVVSLYPKTDDIKSFIIGAARSDISDFIYEWKKDNQ